MSLAMTQWIRSKGRSGIGPRSGSTESVSFPSLGAEQKRLLFQACDRLSLSARGFDRVRRVARTLADLEGTDSIGPARRGGRPARDAFRLEGRFQGPDRLRVSHCRSPEVMQFPLSPSTENVPGSMTAVVPDTVPVTPATTSSR